MQEVLRSTDRKQVTQTGQTHFSMYHSVFIIFQLWLLLKTRITTEMVKYKLKLLLFNHKVARKILSQA